MTLSIKNPNWNPTWITALIAASIVFSSVPTLTACGTEEVPAPGTGSLDPDEIATRLERAAEIVVQLARDPVFRAALAAELAARRTGDHEVLLEDLAELRLGDGRTLAQALDPSGVLEIPFAHLATPGGAPDLETDPKRLLVTWVRPDHEEALTLTYLAADGTRTTGAADVRPEQPVIVVAVNERAPLAARRAQAEHEAAEHALGVQTSALAANSCNDWSCASGSCRTATLNRIKIFNDHEPWYKGDPEIFITCRVPGSPLWGYVVDCGTLDLPRVNDTDTWYNYDRVLLTGLRSGFPMMCYVLESDGTDGDDMLGAALVAYGDFQQTYWAGFEATFTMY